MHAGFGRKIRMLVVDVFIVFHAISGLPEPALKQFKTGESASVSQPLKARVLVLPSAIPRLPTTSAGCPKPTRGMI